MGCQKPYSIEGRRCGKRSVTTLYYAGNRTRDLQISSQVPYASIHRDLCTESVRIDNIREILCIHSFADTLYESKQNRDAMNTVTPHNSERSVQ